MNPFASLDNFETARGAALGGEVEWARYQRREAADARRTAGRNVELRLSARTERMLRLAVASSKAVLLVGPPGTGKTEILEQLISEMDRQPARFGLRRSDVSASWVTPEEEWTFDKIVLGETVVGSDLVSVEGDLLSAISANDWLILDETNRADMDRVLGGVLTWLSEKRVRVGAWRSGGQSDAVPVFLDWSTDANCSVEGTDAGSASRVYRAGTDWRLLGTYNAVDAQRVFRMGQALGRRFKHVPVPPASEADFATIIEARIGDVPRADLIKTKVAALYGAHLSTVDAQLGPGLFIDIPAYLDHGFRMEAEASALGTPNVASGDAVVGGPDDPLQEGVAELESGVIQGEDSDRARVDLVWDTDISGDGSGVREQLLDDLAAEAYLISVGNIIAKYESDLLAELSQELRRRDALSAENWVWVLDSLTAMRA